VGSRAEKIIGLEDVWLTVARPRRSFPATPERRLSTVMLTFPAGREWADRISWEKVFRGG
jgi:hypothetical protein